MLKFVEEVLQNTCGNDSRRIFESSALLRYLDSKMGAVYGDSKTRRSLANIYALYSILHFYSEDFYNDKVSYKAFTGYEYTKLFRFYHKYSFVWSYCAGNQTFCPIPSYTA